MQDPHDSATDIAELLQHLIQLEVPQLLEDGEPAARLLRYSVRILNSRLAGDLTPTHDPVIIREGGIYHVFSTGHGKRLIETRTSTDLVHWTRLPSAWWFLPSSP